MTTPDHVSPHAVLAVHPVSHGFGWALFEGPRTPMDWGFAYVAVSDNKPVLERFEKLITRHVPTTLVLEAFDPDETERSERIQELCKEMLTMARNRAIETRVYSRDAVRMGFEAGETATRHDLAQIVAGRVPDFNSPLPEKRQPWASEDPKQAVYDAAALAITYFTAMGEE